MGQYMRPFQRQVKTTAALPPAAYVTKQSYFNIRTGFQRIPHSTKTSELGFETNLFGLYFPAWYILTSVTKTVHSVAADCILGYVLIWIRSELANQTQFYIWFQSRQGLGNLELYWIFRTKHHGIIKIDQSRGPSLFGCATSLALESLGFDSQNIASGINQFFAPHGDLKLPRCPLSYYFHNERGA